ncbi:MAG: hypothetical protein ACI4OR_01110 [Alphaproteobacteria bacterium]
MKRLIFVISIWVFPLMAAPLSVLEEAAQLGTIAGLASACGAREKLDNYELIAARLIANKSTSEAQEKEGYRRYAEEKLHAMQEHKRSPKLTCGEILNRFQKMPLFKSVVYKDGSLKFYDGTYYPAKGMYVKKNET